MLHRRVRGFTLIELLVVIAIISVLIGIGLTVATTVLQSGRSQATQSTLINLETILSSLSAETDLRPKDYTHYTRVESNGSEVRLPMIDAREPAVDASKDRRAAPSLARFLRFAEESVPGVGAQWKQLDASLIRESDIGLGNSFGSGGGTSIEVSGTEVLDQWGNPIRFVHPSFDGGYGEWYDSMGSRDSTRDEIDVEAGMAGDERTYRRSFRPFDPTAAEASEMVGDADEGICVSGRPYFYSAGADGDPGTRADNVYGDAAPRYPAETDGQE